MSPAGAPPDWAALYSRHKDVMYRVAATVLRDAGLAGQAGDAVQDAMVSLMGSPPKGVRNWEAVMVAAAKRKAIDRLRSAAVRHVGPELSVEHGQPSEADEADGVADLVDRQRLGAQAWDALAVLGQRHRQVVRQYVVLERPRAKVAEELGVTPARVSQITTQALRQLKDALSREEEGA